MTYKEVREGNQSEARRYKIIVLKNGKVNDYQESVVESNAPFMIYSHKFKLSSVNKFR